MLTEKSIAIQNMRGQGFYRDAKDDNGSKKSGKFKKSKYISLVFYNVPDIKICQGRCHGK